MIEYLTTIVVLIKKPISYIGFSNLLFIDSRTSNCPFTTFNELVQRGVGIISIQDPINTTTAQGRLMFNLFASLAEFEKDLIR